MLMMPFDIAVCIKLGWRSLLPAGPRTLFLVYRPAHYSRRTDEVPLTRRCLPISYMVTTSIQHSQNRHRYSQQASGDFNSMGT